MSATLRFFLNSITFCEKLFPILPLLTNLLTFFFTSSDDVESMKKLYLHNPYILTLREVGDGKDETVPKNVLWGISFICFL